MSMYNTDESIYGFAHSCMNQALSRMVLYLSTKNTILRHDGHFKDIFQEVFENEFAQKFAVGITYEHDLSMIWLPLHLRDGGFVWACRTTTETFSLIQ